MSEETRRIVPIEEAIERIGDSDYIHTFMTGGFALLGCDHERATLIENMRKHGVEESGAQACALGHTLVIVRYPTDGERTTPLFIEAKARSEASKATV